MRFVCSTVKTAASAEQELELIRFVWDYKRTRSCANSCETVARE